VNRIKNFYSYQFNNNNFIDLLLNLDLELEFIDLKNFSIQIKNLKSNKYFFDIYNFIGFDIDTDIELVKSKYAEFKTQLTNSTESKSFFQYISI